LVVLGLLNKQGAASLGISEVTYQIHRGNIMRKMAAASLAELVRMSIKLGIPTASDNKASSQGRYRNRLRLIAPVNLGGRRARLQLQGGVGWFRNVGGAAWDSTSTLSADSQ
jgi:hypothetical protein